MSDAGKQVKLMEWPCGGALEVGARGTVLSDSTRYLVMQWGGISRPTAMRPEEVALA